MWLWDMTWGWYQVSLAFIFMWIFIVFMGRMKSGPALLLILSSYVVSFAVYSFFHSPGEPCSGPYPRKFLNSPALYLSAVESVVLPLNYSPVVRAAGFEPALRASKARMLPLNITP